MIESARLAISYVEGYGREDFIADRRTQQATVLNLLVNGRFNKKLIANNLEFARNFQRRPRSDSIQREPATLDTHPHKQ